MQLGELSFQHCRPQETARPCQFWHSVMPCISICNSPRSQIGSQWISKRIPMQKRSERRKHCALAAVRRSEKCSPPPQTPFPGAQDSQNLISWRWSLPLTTNSVWWGSMHAISSYRGNRATHKHSHKPTNRQDWLQYTALLSLARTVIKSHAFRSNILVFKWIRYDSIAI